MQQQQLTLIRPFRKASVLRSPGIQRSKATEKAFVQGFLEYQMYVKQNTAQSATLNVLNRMDILYKYEPEHMVPGIFMTKSNKPGMNTAAISVEM